MYFTHSVSNIVPNQSNLHNKIRNAKIINKWIVNTEILTTNQITPFAMLKITPPLDFIDSKQIKIIEKKRFECKNNKFDWVGIMFVATFRINSAYCFISHIANDLFANFLSGLDILYFTFVICWEYFDAMSNECNNQIGMTLTLNTSSFTLHY